MAQRHFVTGAVLICLAGICLATALAGKKKNPDDFTQTLALPKEPPPVSIGETRRLVFHVTPLSGKGLLAQQVRDALRALLKLNGGLPVIHLRAFVAGSGDVRRISQIVGEVFGERKTALPSVSLVRAGGLPLENAQVVFEAVSVARRDVNSGSLDFVVTEAVTAPDPFGSPQPLLTRSLDELAQKLKGETAVAVTCFVSSLSDGAALSAAVASRFPSAATHIVQPQRGPFQARSLCEAVARGGSRISAEKLAFSGTRVAFGSEEKDARLALQRLDRDLTAAGAPLANTVFKHLYPLSVPLGEMFLKLCPSATPVAVIPIEGLASMDGALAVDAVATVSP